MSAVIPFVNGTAGENGTLVVVFLRGGADGLNMVAPLDDDGYYRARPRIAIAKSDAPKLDGFFGLNPLLRELQPMFAEGELAIVHAAGSEDDSRSHFEAQDLMEHGGTVAGGWLGRFLRSRSNAVTGPLSAVALGRSLPESLRGAPSATAMERIEDFGLGANSRRLARALEILYASEGGPLGDAGRDTIAALKRIESVQSKNYKPAHGVAYGTDRFARGLMELARLIKAGIGMDAACIDLEGWDSHTSQGLIMDPLLVRLSRGLSAFYRDLGPAMSSVTVVVMTEFGRRLAENSAFGTDHGRGSVMFVLGGGVHGGRVYGKWPGLTDDVLEGPGDLPVTTNYRNVLAPILQRHCAALEIERVFPGFTTTSLPLYA